MSWAIWVSGPSGSGKTAVARAAAVLLRARAEPVRVLELDELRSRLVPEPKYTEAEHELVYRGLGYMAAKLTEAGMPVIVAATAHHYRWRELARAAIPRFAEVQLGRARAGVDTPHEPSRMPELANGATRADVAALAAAVFSLAKELGAGVQTAREGATRWAIWITGRPGSGKTTLARRVAEVLRAASVPVKVLDLGSARRAIVGREWAIDAEEAFVHRTLALTSKLLTESGVAVILDATAPRRAWRDTAREWIAHFAEVQLVCPSEICGERERAVRWHLGDARTAPGAESTRPDIALDYEESLHPDLRLHTNAADLITTVDEVLRLAERLEQAAISRSAALERTMR